MQNMKRRFIKLIRLLSTSLSESEYGDDKMTKNLRTALGVKGFLCLASLVAIASALVTYTAIVTITQARQFTIGATTASWTVYINDVNKETYLPGDGTPAGSTPPVNPPTDTNSSTFAFKVVTTSGQVCAVKIELTAPVNSSEFSKFEIRVKYWNTGTSTWDNETLYDAPTGSTSISYIDGLTAGSAGYVHHAASLSGYYMIHVTCSYDVVDNPTPKTVTFQYTPLPQGSF